MTAKMTADRKTISVPAEGELLRAIEARAAARDLPLGQAVMTFVKEGVDSMARPPALVNLEATSTDDLIDELVGRLQQIGTVEEANARAEAAEAKLFQVASVIGGTAIA